MSGDVVSGTGVGLLYHPSHHVPDLDEAEEFFARVFGRSSTRLSTLSDREPPDGWSNDYATFTPIADVLFDCIDPRRYLVAGRHLYEPVDEPRLKGLGWYVDDPAGLYRSLRDHGFTVLDQMGEVASAGAEGSDEPPTAAGARMPLFFTSPHDAGLRHELLPRIPFPLDHRLAPGWTPGVVDPGDPLGIVGCAHHTIRTRRPERALRLLVDVFGGTVVRQGRDDLLDVDATFVRLADTVIELAARVDGSTDSGDDGRGSGSGIDTNDGHGDGGDGDVGVGVIGDHDDGDVYDSIAFRVVDLDRAAQHLSASGVEIAARTDRAILTDPKSSLGIAWRFTSSAEADPAM